MLAVVKSITLWLITTTRSSRKGHKKEFGGQQALAFFLMVVYVLLFIVEIDACGAIVEVVLIKISNYVLSCKRSEPKKQTL